MNRQLLKYDISDNGIFPNSCFPVLHYKGVLKLPWLSPANFVKKLFHKNNWKNNWKNGIYTFHHYHSTTHEALGVIKGSTMLQLGGEDGKIVLINKGDVLIIPAGVAHKNLQSEMQVICIGAYPDGRNYDMNYGRPGERPHADQNIAALPMPASDPVFGGAQGVFQIWSNEVHHHYTA